MHRAKQNQVSYPDLSHWTEIEQVMWTVCFCSDDILCYPLWNINFYYCSIIVVKSELVSHQMELSRCTLKGPASWAKQNLQPEKTQKEAKAGSSDNWELQKEE